MLKIFLNVLYRLLEPADENISEWRDPLMHPALQVMNERELADLPLSAGYYKAARDIKCTA